MSFSKTIATYIEKNDVSLSVLETVLGRYKLQSLLPEIMRILKRKEALRKERSSVVIESPFPLSDDSVLKIKTIMDVDKNADHSIKINPELLAGFKARHNDTLYDASAERIIKQFTKNY